MMNNGTSNEFEKGSMSDDGMDSISVSRSATEYTYLYILKIVAAFLVSWAHFVVTGCYETTSVHGVLNNFPNGMPLLPVGEHNLWKLDSFFYVRWGIESADLGVVLFFFASGFLIPHLQMKYNNNMTGGGYAITAV